MKEKLKHYLKEILLFIFVMTIFSNGISYYKSINLNKEKLYINNFQLIDKNQYIVNKNKPIIVHFWATWCPTCKLESDNIDKISKDYEVITVAVSSGTNEEIKKYLKEYNLSFNVVNDISKELAQKFQISAYPTTFIYDKNHNLVFSEVGYTSLLGLYLRMWYASI